MSATPDGTGTGWTLTEAIDVDQPIGLSYRALIHLAKAVRKRVGKEHETFADVTVGGEHIPGYCKVLKHVDATGDVSAAQDATLFQNNGIVHSAGNQTLWCITGAASDPTILLIDPDKQYKGGDITWTGAQQFDASVDMTILHVDGSLTADRLVCQSQADFSDAHFTGDVTLGKAVQVDGTFSTNGATRLIGDATMYGMMSFCANNLYDSSWFDLTAGASSTKTHDLSSTCLLAQVYWRDTLNYFGYGANTVFLAGSGYYYFVGLFSYPIGPQISNLTTTQLTVSAGVSGTFACWTASGAVTSSCGSYRVITMRMK